MSTQPSELLGQLVGEGRFLISRCLRDGGMAQLYQGEDTTTGNPVIIKVPKLTQVQIDNSFRQRFLREIQALKRLVHPNIVRILCSGEEKGVPFVVMRFLDGGTLGDRMYSGPGQTARPQAPESLGTWLPTIAQVLDYIHSQNYVHRDVKPYNILFDASGKPFLGDLGIARALTTQPDHGASLTPEREQPPGTRPYMAPEQINRQKVGPHTDQYALAVVVYEWLSGRRPFPGDTLEEIAQSQRLPPTPLKFALPGLPEGISQAVARALSYNPQDRFPSCRDFAHQVMASLGLATPQLKSASATQVANNPDTWSLPISEFEPVLQRKNVNITAAPPLSTPRDVETAPKSATTRSEPSVSVPAPVQPTAPPSSPLLKVVRWSALVILLVIAALAGSFFLPGTGVQRIVGAPFDSLLKTVSAPGWRTNDDEKPVVKETENAADPRLMELQREKALLAQKLDATVAQLAKTEDARTDAEKDKKATEERLAADSEKLKKVEGDYKSALKAKTDAEDRLTAAKEQLKKTEDKLSKLDSDKGGIAKEMDTLRADLKKAREDARTEALKAKEAATKELADAKEKLTTESAKAKKAADDLQAAREEKDATAKRLASVQEKLKTLDDTLKQVMVCFVLYNRTDAAISFEIRYLSRNGEWTDWKKSKLPPFAETKKRARYQSAGGAIAIQLRYETDNGSKIVDLDGQLFRGKRDPTAADIDSWYAFEKSGADIVLRRIPRKQ